MYFKKHVSLLWSIVLLLVAGRHGYSQQGTAAVNKDSLLKVLAASGNDSMRSFLYNELGRAYGNEKEYKTAIQYFQQALPYKERAGDYISLSKANYNIANSYVALLDINTAISYFEKAKKYAEKPGSGQFLPQIFRGLIGAENSIGNSAQALDHSQQLLKLAEMTSDKKLAGLAYYFIGYHYHVVGNYDKALQNYTSALTKYESVKDTGMIASLQINIGEYYFNKENLDSAAKYFNRSLETYTLLHDKEKIATLFGRLGSIYSARKEYDSVVSMSKRSMALVRELGDKRLLSYFGYQAEVARFIKLYSSAAAVDNKPVFDRAQKEILTDIIKNMGDNLQLYQQQVVNHLEISNMYNGLSFAKEMNQDYAGALNDFKVYTAYRDSLVNTENIKQFADVEAKYAFEKSRDSLQLLEEQKRLELQKEIALNSLRFEYERKRALAKTEEERKRLMLEEDLKRKMIESTYTRNREEAKAKYTQDMALARAEREKQEALSRLELRRSNNIRNMSLAGAGLLLLLAAGAVWAYTQKRRDNKLIAAEKTRSDNLLLNILPEEVAEELKRNGRSTARRYDEVTVLFTDFVNFTTMSEQLSPEALVAELNVCFTAFDHILERHGLEKIKTIGDAYLAVSGLPVRNQQHAVHAVNAALDIVDFVEKRKTEVSWGLDIRVGINSGPLVAGIVGVRKFAYDIWGDTVNTASRMESNSVSGRINISESTYQLVKDTFICSHRGKMAVKNKGDMDMYFVEKHVILLSKPDHQIF